MAWQYYKDRLPKEIVEVVEEYLKDGLYSPDYVEYDAGGMLRVRCMRCGAEVVGRDQERATCPACHKVFELPVCRMKRRANFAQVRKHFGDRGFVELLVCENCKPQVDQSDPATNRRIKAQIVAAGVKEMVMAGKPIGRIKAMVDEVRVKEVENVKE